MNRLDEIARRLSLAMGNDDRDPSVPMMVAVCMDMRDLVPLLRALEATDTAMDFAMRHSDAAAVFRTRDAAVEAEKALLTHLREDAK
jgi:hypothetical protein